MVTGPANPPPWRPHRQSEPQTETVARPTCQYPGCENPPEAKDPSTPGPAPKYCEREDHTALTAFRAKRRKTAEAAGRPEPDDLDRPVPMAAATAVDLRGEVITQMERLTGDLGRYVEQLQTITDPEAAEAQMLAVTNGAAAKVSEAQREASTERTRRITAEQATKAAAAEAAEQAVTELDDARTRFEAEVERIRAEAAREVEEMKATVEREQKAAARVKADAVREVEGRVRTAEEHARQATRDPEARAAAVEKSAAQLRDELYTELQRARDDAERAGARVSTLETRVDELRDKLDKAREAEDRARTEEETARARK
ncbi:hypothetical protein ACFWOL_32125 [Streptomyces sp. NPDC058442]|uniref:hypothetical protein n=1 Tax=Streptomyces sp. NPDC058442 TaxID=3346503 RepID=UPI00364FCEE6